MPITFTRAVTVEPGEAITSRQMASLSHAFNSRLRSGLGDGTYRIPYYLFQAARQIRNSDGGFLFPPQGEYFEQYQCLDPQDGEWPASFAGTAEGVNVSNPLGAFVFGNESANIDNETDRIETVAYLVNGAAPVTLADYWTLGQMQRGAVDPDTGAIASPALDAARLHMRIAYSVRSPYGNSYGAYRGVSPSLWDDSDSLGWNMPKKGKKNKQGKAPALTRAPAPSAPKLSIYDELSGLSLEELVDWAESEPYDVAETMGRLLVECRKLQAMNDTLMDLMGWKDLP